MDRLLMLIAIEMAGLLLLEVDVVFHSMIHGSQYHT